MYDAIDLFAGPGGWDVAARDLGLNVLGIEWDKHAVATRHAAGLPTVHGDVRGYGPGRLPSRGLIASPPCTTFSAAGKGRGRASMPQLLDALAWVASTGLAAKVPGVDETSLLVLDPMRWVARAHQMGAPYEWIAMEQVPTVLPVWEAYAQHLRGMGYSVATGRLQAEMFGVPQTRKRAVLVARMHGEARLPAPTHSRFYPRDPKRLDPGVLPWASMADALGFCGAALRSNYGTGGDPAARGMRTADQPAATVTSKAGRGKWVTPALVGERREDCAWVERRPSPTVVGSFAPDIAAKTGAVRVTPDQAAALQSFPAGYPWQGAEGQIFQQIGNAIPPLLARAVLAEATGVARAAEEG